ncbi:hypothetical protein ACLRAN_09015, partial [[Pasteurella] aerogenes]
WGNEETQTIISYHKEQCQLSIKNKENKEHKENKTEQNKTEKVRSFFTLFLIKKLKKSPHFYFFPLPILIYSLLKFYMLNFENCLISHKLATIFKYIDMRFSFFYFQLACIAL